MNQFWKCTLAAICVAAGLFSINHLHQFARAQDAHGDYGGLGGGLGFPEDSGGGDGPGGKSKFSTPPEMHQAAQAAKTVEDIRKFELDGYSATLGVDDLSSGKASLEHHRFPTLPEAKERLSQLRTGLLDPKSDRVGLEPEIDKALNAYFVVDMKSRVTELDKIKERVKEMEVQLERRMKSKDEIIDLQKKVILSESNGLGFFSADERTGSSDLMGAGGGYGGAGGEGEMSGLTKPGASKRTGTTTFSGRSAPFDQHAPPRRSDPFGGK